MSTADDAAWIGGMAFVVVGGYIAAIIIAAAIVGLIALAILSAVIAVLWGPKMFDVVIDWGIEITSGEHGINWRWFGPVMAGLLTTTGALIFFDYEVPRSQTLSHAQISILWVFPALACYFEAIALPWIAEWILDEDQAWLAYPVLITALPALAGWIAALIRFGSHI